VIGPKCLRGRERSPAVEQRQQSAGHLQAPLPCQVPARPVIEKDLVRSDLLGQSNGFALARIDALKIAGQIGRRRQRFSTSQPAAKASL